MMKKLVISYSDKERESALKIREQLDEAGHDVWIADNNIKGAVHWTQSILDAIDGCEGLILVWSEGAKRSEDVREEIRLARVFRKPIFPVLAHPMPRVPSLPEEIETLQVIKLGNLDDNIVELKARLADPEKSNIKYAEVFKNAFLPKAHNPYFVGRIRELRDLFVDSRGYGGRTKTGIPIAISGLPGIGKTHLALAFGYRFNLFYSDGVYWADAQIGIVDEYGRIGHQIHVKRFRDEHPRDYAVRVREKLCQLPNGLIIFDNVTDFTEFREWYPQGAQSCSVILTSRMPPRGIHVKTINLTELDSDAAYEMLIARRQDGEEIRANPVQRDALNEICRIIGNHPLALELCASRLQSAFFMPSDYLQFIRPDPLMRLGDENMNDVSIGTGTASLWKIFRNSYASLDEKLVDPYFLLMCCFAPQVINQGHIIQAYGKPDEGVRALDKLANVSFVRREQHNTLSLHPLVAQLGRVLLKDKDFDYPGKFVDVMLGFLRAHDDSLTSEVVRREKLQIDEALRIAEMRSLWDACANLYEYDSDIEAGLQEQIKALENAYHIIEQYLPEQKRRLPGLRLRLGKVHSAAGRVRQALDDFNQAESQYRRIKDVDPAEAASLYYALGDTYLALGRYAEAGETLSDALEKAATHLDDSAPEVLQLRQALARHALYLGDYDKAGTGLSKVLEERKKFYDAHPDAASASGLVAVHADLSRLELTRAHYLEAMQAANAALAIIKDFKENDLDRSQLYLLIGDIQYESGAYNQAEEQLEKVCQDILATFGERHPNYGRALKALGEVHRKQGKFGKAEMGVKQAIEIFRNVYGDSHPSVAEALAVQAKIYDHLCEFDKEQDVWERVLKIQGRFYAEQHPALAATHYDYASLFLRKGEYAKAAEHLNQSLAITKNSLGKEHTEYYGRLVRLATCLYEQQQYSDAQKKLDEAKGLQKAIFKGSPHPYVARMLQLQSEVLRRQGSFTEALAVIDDTIKMKKEIYRTVDHPSVEDHPSVAEALEVKVDLLLSQYRLEERDNILAVLDAIEHIRKNVYGISHPQYANYQLRLASLYEIDGQYDDASKILEQSLQTCLNVFSAEHPETLKRQIVLARMARMTNNIVLAESRINLVCEALVTRLKTEDSQIVADTYQERSYIRRAQGDYQDALTELEHALRIEIRIFGTESPAAIELQNEKAKLLILFYRFAEAEDILKSALRYVDTDQPIFKRLKSDLLGQRGILQDHLMKYDQAIVNLDEAIKLRKNLLGDENVELARLHIEKAVVLRHQGKYVDAFACLDVAQSIDNRHFKAADHIYYARILLEQGQVCLVKRDYLAAQAFLDEALQIYAVRPNRNVKQYADVAESLGRSYLETGSLHAAFKMFQKAMEIRTAIYGGSHPEIFETLKNQEKALLKMLETEETGDLNTRARQDLKQVQNMLRQRDNDNIELAFDKPNLADL